MARRRHGRRFALSLGLGCLLLPAALPLAASAATLASGFWAQTVADGLSQPTAVAWLPDGRMLAAEKPGVVRVVETDGSVDPKPLLDISDEVNDAGDRGLLGIAVAPDFATSRKLYLLYVYDATYAADHASGQDQPNPEVSRLTRVVLDDKGVPGPEHTILGSVGTAPCPAAANDVDCIPADGLSHAIGTVRADPDGTLWIGSGDGVTAGDVDARAVGAYDEQGFRGKIVHVDGDGHGLAGHPFCPDDADTDHVCTKVYAKGFRNPFRFSLRSGGAGPLVGDVGWQTWEEIDRVTSGGDYGWPCYEGPIHTPGYSDLPECPAEFASGAIAPDYAYDHSVGKTVVGGFVYQGTGYPAAYSGQAIFGDYTEGFVRWLELDAPGGPAVTPLADDLVAVDLEPAPDNGDVVYVGYSPLGEGVVGRIVYSASDGPPTAVASADVTSGSSPLKVQFDAGQSTDPEGDALTYHWSFGDGSPDSTEKAPLHTYAAAGAYQATLRVQDPHGLQSTDHVRIAVDDHPPVATLAAPGAGDTYADGDLVHLVGSATDAEDGTLTGASLSWRIVLHDGTGDIDLPSRVGERPVFPTRTDHDASASYEVVLTATDSAGLTGTASVTIHPRTAQLQIDSDPPGAPIAYHGVGEVAPWQTSAAVGFQTTVSAAASFTANGHDYAFDHWSDAGDPQHLIAIPADGLTLVASYRDVTPTPAAPETAPDAPPSPPDYQPADSGLGARLPGDSRGPTVSSVRLDRRHRRLTGRVVDPSGVARLDVALRGWRAPGGGCRWWSPVRGGLRGGSSCLRPAWLRATVHGRGWSLALGAAPPPRVYVALFRARDALGNLSRASVATRSTT